jgi:hypothetical protein
LPVGRGHRAKKPRTAEDNYGGKGGGGAPGYKKGGLVKKTGLALVHKGELVVPARVVRNMKTKWSDDEDELEAFAKNVLRKR